MDDLSFVDKVDCGQRRSELDWQDEEVILLILISMSLRVAVAFERMEGGGETSTSEADYSGVRDEYHES